MKEDVKRKLPDWTNAWSSAIAITLDAPLQRWTAAFAPPE
jgi:hypothetical protein